MQAGDRVELLRNNGKYVLATVERVLVNNQLITLHFQESGLTKEKNIRFHDAEKLLRLVTSPRFTPQWELGAALEVKRSDGTWQRAMVQEINTTKQLYQVLFLIDGATKGKTVPFDLAASMLRPLSEGVSKPENGVAKQPPSASIKQPTTTAPAAPIDKADESAVSRPPPPKQPAQPRTYVNPMSGETTVPKRNPTPGRPGKGVERTSPQPEEPVVVVHASSGGNAAHLADIFEDLCDALPPNENDWLEEHIDTVPEVPDHTPTLEQSEAEDATPTDSENVEEDLQTPARFHSPEPEWEGGGFSEAEGYGVVGSGSGSIAMEVAEEIEEDLEPDYGTIVDKPSPALRPTDKDKNHIAQIQKPEKRVRAKRKKNGEKKKNKVQKGEADLYGEHVAHVE
uniref:Kinesin-like protein KIF2A-like N-terminal domain-containing protein n=1 Tax=Eutreptiella gymnastica TaxID=73025 RepID=A0A7S1NVR9_9EUGL|mmetsp:Transcript_96802/g.166908  ORF Transcript_96802/g.166908 Transcript_96802/m.166908 type:complete len:397 (+) Transcript_96802:54-1244(+)